MKVAASTLAPHGATKGVAEKQISYKDDVGETIEFRLEQQSGEYKLFKYISGKSSGAIVTSLKWQPPRAWASGHAKKVLMLVGVENLMTKAVMGAISHSTRCSTSGHWLTRRVFSTTSLSVLPTQKVKTATTLRVALSIRKGCRTGKDVRV